MIQRTHRRDRGGFTLIELLVVVAIIGVLASLVAVAVFGFLGSQSQSNTKLLLQKVDNGIQQQWSEVRQQAQQEVPPASIIALAGGDATRAQVIWVKLKLKQQFPMSYAEALNPGAGLPNPGDLPPVAAYWRKLNNGTLTQAKDPTTESAACLLMALSLTRKGKKFNAEEALGANAIKDTDGDGLPEIVDGWGKSIGFCRWGTGNAGLTGLTKGTSAYNNDTQDPLMALMNATWNASPSATLFQQVCHPIRGSNGSPQSYFTIPVIVSAGKDGIMGLNLPGQPNATYPWDMSPLASGGSGDNIFSYQVR